MYLLLICINRCKLLYNWLMACVSALQSDNVKQTAGNNIVTTNSVIIYFFLLSLCYSYWNQMILLAKNYCSPSSKLPLAARQSERHCKWWASAFITLRLVFSTDYPCIVTVMICYSMLVYNAISFSFYEIHFFFGSHYLI